MTDIGREIAAALASNAAEELEEELRARLRLAREVVGTIPSGTLDADLTPAQLTALDEYETVIAALAGLREERLREERA